MKKETILSLVTVPEDRQVFVVFNAGDKIRCRLINGFTISFK